MGCLLEGSDNVQGFEAMRNSNVGREGYWDSNVKKFKVR